MQVSPAGVFGPDAEVVFFAIALAEVFDVEQAHFVECRAPDIHAKSDAGGHIDDLASVGLGKQLVEAAHVPPDGQGIVLTEAWVAANCGVVRERRDAGDALVAVGRGLNTIQPVIGHLGIAVEQQHVVGR